MVAAWHVSMLAAVWHLKEPLAWYTNTSMAFVIHFS